jgi:hypothetical protein
MGKFKGATWKAWTPVSESALGRGFNRGLNRAHSQRWDGKIGKYRDVKVVITNMPRIHRVWATRLPSGGLANIGEETQKAWLAYKGKLASKKTNEQRRAYVNFTKKWSSSM